MPTIYVGEYVAEGRAAAGSPVWLDMVKIHAETFRRAVKAGVKIAFGTDVGGFDWKIDPAIEFPLMVKYGMTPAQALHSATSNAAELLGMADRILVMRRGCLVVELNARETTQEEVLKYAAVEESVERGRAA